MILEWVLSSCVLILVVLVLRAALGKKISARLRYALWAVVLLRLLVPVQLFTSPVAGLSTALPQIEALDEQSIYVLPIQRAPVESDMGVVVQDGDIISDSNSFGYAKLENDGETVTRYAQRVSSIQLLQGMWIIGSAFTAFVLAICNLRFFRRLRRNRVPLEGAECALPVYRAAALPSPCLFGLLRPAVYVTSQAAEDQVMLRHVLVHEETHFRHRDHIWSFLRCAALALHWWNPLVWLAARLSKQDGELACDEGVLRRLGDGERSAYGETLLALVTAKSRPGDLLTCATTMTGDKRGLKDRIGRIACQRKYLTSVAVTVVLLMNLAVVCAFGRMTGEEIPSESSMETWQADLTHDGSQETLRLEEDSDSGTQLLTVEDSSGSVLWSAEGNTSHAGWNAYFLTEWEGEDYLLWYQPGMWQGECDYRYRLFYLKEGQEAVVQEGSVQFSVNFATEDSLNFDTAAIAALIEEVNSLLADSIQLMNTDANLLATFEKEGRLIDTIWWLEDSWDGTGSPEAALEEFASYAIDHPDDVDNTLKEYLEVLTAADIAAYDGGDQAAKERLGRLLRAASGQRVSRVYEYDSFAAQDVSGFSQAEMTVRMTDGSTLYLVAAASGNVYICHETAEGALSAFFDAEELCDLICQQTGGQEDTKGAPDVDTILSSIQADQITHIDYSQTVTARDLADALNGAAGKWTPYEGENVEGFLYDLYPYWSIYAEYVNSTWSSSEQTITLGAGLQENWVLLTCSGYHVEVQTSANPTVGGTYLHDAAYSYTVMVEDEELYWLVRRAYDYPEQIERGLVEPMYGAITAKMEETLQLAQEENPEAGYTGYALTEFYTLAAFDDIVPGAEVVLYQNRFALILEHPENMVWAGGVYLDSQLREEGVPSAAGGLLAVVWRDGEAEQYRFLANDFYMELENESWMEEYGRPYIRQALENPNFW